MTEAKIDALLEKLDRGEKLSVDEVVALLDEFPPEQVRAMLIQKLASPGVLEGLITAVFTTPWETPDQRERAASAVNGIVAHFRKIPNRPQ